MPPPEDDGPTPAAINPDVARARREERSAIRRRKKVTTDAATARTKTTFDSFQNFVASVGVGTNNVTSASGYGFSPITRNHIELEWMYRGSWIIQVAVDYLADDTMARGIKLGSELDPEDGEKLLRAIRKSGNWDKLRLTHKWGRLYGGCMAIMMIDGQDMKTPLNIESIRPGQFKGLIVMDRWMVNASVGELVESPGDDFGQPKYYDVQVAIPGLGNARVHHSRCLRIDGIELPYWQKVSENYWSMSVVEPLWDRLIAFDSTTLGAAQLVFKAYLRTWKVKGLRDILGSNVIAEQALVRNAQYMRQFQSNESISLVDAEDEFDAQTYSFAGLPETLQQFAQQLSGALGIPLVRLFGQSPSGFSSGEADISNYDDNVEHHQEARVRKPLDKLLQVSARSIGIKLPDTFSWTFNPFRVLDENQKADVAEKITRTVGDARERGLVSDQAAAKELKQQSVTTGIFTNITDDFIEQLDDKPPPAGEGEMGGGEGAPGIPDMGAGAGAGAAGQNEERSDQLQPQMEEDSVIPQGRTNNWRRVHFHVVDAARELMLHGLPIYLETRRGEERRGLRGWTTKMPADYGFIRNTGSAEGPSEGLDVFVGPERDSKEVFVIDQVDPSTGDFDEHKCMLAYPSRVLALRDYQRAFSDGSGAARIGGVKHMSMDQFKDWLENGDCTKPVAA